MQAATGGAGFPPLVNYGLQCLGFTLLKFQRQSTTLSPLEGLAAYSYGVFLEAFEAEQVLCRKIFYSDQVRDSHLELQGFPVRSHPCLGRVAESKRHQKESFTFRHYH